MKSSIYDRMLQFTAIAFTIVMLCVSGKLSAQDTSAVIQRGNYFVVTASAKSGPVKTKYIYIDKDSVEYEIYLSSKGNAFIYKVSKNGKIYKKYLPEVTEKLGTKNDKTEDNNGKRLPRH